MARREGAGDEIVNRVPVTSVSLLRTLADDPLSVRWSELYAKYEPLMRTFLKARFPSLEPDDLIQETMLALSKVIPNYSYSPETNGSFHNYLTSILKHKAVDAVNRNKRKSEVMEDYRKEREALSAPDDAEESALRSDALEIAIAGLLADETVNPMHRTVFRRVALERESPDAVAASLGISRANVDQIKKRLIVRLSSIVSSLMECAS